MIKELLPHDLSLTRDCAFGFFAESQLPGELQFTHWAATWADFMDRELGVIIGCFDDQYRIQGMIGGLCVQCWMTAQLEAIEAFWYVMPEIRGGVAGIRLLRAFENWAENRGAKRIKMMHLAELNAETMRDIYLRMGYKPLEQAYTKEL